MLTTDTDEIEGVANALFSAIEQGDTGAIEVLFADDIAVWHSGDRRDNDRARALRVLHWFIDITTERHYDIFDREFFSSGSAPGFVQQHVLHATGRNGGSIALRVCIVIKMRQNNLISRIDEYFDPADMAVLMN
jgi:ketosteroid isomerase-like protein